MISFSDYQIGDMLRLTVREGDSLGVPLIEPPGLAWTMKKDGKVAACLGVEDAGGGVGMLWMYTSEIARGHGIPMFRFGRKVVTGLFDILGYHRVQTVIRADCPEYERWALLFGFEKEGVMRKASPTHEDVLLYARVKA